MTIYNVYAGEAHWAKGGRFRPKGPLVEYGRSGRALQNPASRMGAGGLSARLFVGLNVGDEQKWTPDDVVDRLIAIRKEQKAAVDSTLLSQRGLYTNRAGKIIDEESVQLIIIDMEEMKQNVFEKQMIKLAEKLAGELEQESIILEIQKRGIVQEQYSVTPRKKRKKKRGTR